MVLLTLLIQITSLISLNAHAAFANNQGSNCKNELNVILNAAEQKVRSTYKVDDSCGIGALKGSAAGADCQGWGITQLKMTLSSYYYAAQNVCKKSCAAEGKQKACEALITTDYLVSRGILGLKRSVTKINYIPTDDGLYFEDFSSAAEVINAVYDQEEAPKSAGTIEI
jgi:hypothetical protein